MTPQPPDGGGAPPAWPERSDQPTARVRMTVAYDGSGFHGFAAQASEVPTVAGTLTRAIGRRVGHPVELVAAGRTDAGVHAWGQVVSFDAALDPTQTDGLRDSLNRALAPAIVVRLVEIASGGFDARRSARSRCYRYTVLNRHVPDPFLGGTAWHVAEPLDLVALRLACDPLIGEHDFTSFCRRPRRTDREVSMTRRVLNARWVRVNDEVLRFEIEASSFCHQMVRSLVGFHVAVGTGRRKAGEVASVLRSCNRAAAPHLAPPHGLCLWEVRY